MLIESLINQQYYQKGIVEEWDNFIMEWKMRENYVNFQIV